MMIIFGNQTGLMNNYYILDGQEISGPYSLASLKDQPISRSALIRIDSSEEWRKVSEVEELHSIVSQDIHPVAVTQSDLISYTSAINGQRKRKSKKLIAIFIALLIGLSICSVGWVYKKHPQQKQVQAQVTSIQKESTSEPDAPKEANLQSTQIPDSKDKEYRQHWRKYIRAENSSYGYGVLGGINNLSIVFSNKTDYPMDELKAKVTYIKANGKPWKSKFISVFNLAPHSEQKQAMPKVNRGKSVKVSIIKVVSSQMNFRYEE